MVLGFLFEEISPNTAWLLVGLIGVLVLLVVFLTLSRYWSRVWIEIPKIFKFIGQRDRSKEKERGLTSKQGGDTDPKRGSDPAVPTHSSGGKSTASSHDQSKILDLFSDVSAITKDLTKILGSKEFQGQNYIPSDLLFGLCNRVHTKAQSVFEDLLGHDQEVVVSFKTIDPSDPRFLKCYYLSSSLPPRRMGRDGLGEPKRIFVVGSVAGRVFTTGKPEFVPNVANQPGAFQRDVFEETQKYKIGSLVAWPVHVQQEVVAVLKIDARGPNTLKEEDRLTRQLVQDVARQFELAFQIACREHGVLFTELTQPR